MNMVFSAFRLWLIWNHSMSSRKHPFARSDHEFILYIVFEWMLTAAAYFSPTADSFKKKKKPGVKYGWRNDNIQTAMLGQTWRWSHPPRNWRDPLQNQAWLTISRTLRSAQLQKGGRDNHGRGGMGMTDAQKPRPCAAAVLGPAERSQPGGRGC